MIFNPWVLLGAVLAAVGIAIGGYTFGVDVTSTKYENKIKDQKLEAQRVLADVIRLNGIKEESDRQRAITNQKDYDESLKSLVDSNRKYAGQLRDPGRRAGSSCPASQGSASPNTVEVVPVDSGVQNAPREIFQPISDEAAKFLREEADNADRLATWAKSCFLFVNERK